MINNKIRISFFQKLLVLISNRYLLILIVLNLPIIIIFIEKELLQRIEIKNLIFQIVVSFLLIVILLIDWFRKLEILKNCYVDIADTIGEIEIPFQKARTERLILKLTLGLSVAEKKFIKQFYFIRKSLIDSDFKYKVVVSKDRPDRFILLNSLPQIVRKTVENR